MRILEEVIAALTENGISACRAYPGGNAPAPDGVVAAVGIHRADERQTQVLVTVLAPASMGGAVCENTAAAAGNILRNSGAEWEQFDCKFDTRSQMFSAVGYATFSAVEKVAVTLAGTALTHVDSVTIWRETDKEVTALENATWHFRLEEVFPAGAREVNPAEPFSLVLSRQGYREACTGCVLTVQKRQADSNGVRYIREGTIQTHSISE